MSPAATEEDVASFDALAPLPTGRLVLEASAGTGKTYTIATLAVRFVAEVDGVGAGGLCVVSFTEAATAELRSRIRQRMVEVADALDSPGETTDPLALSYRALPPDRQRVVSERLRRATEEFDRAVITTIHGFCSRILSTLGVSVGAVGPGGEEVAEVVNDLLLTRARPLAGPLDRPAADDPPPWPARLPRLRPDRFRDAVQTLVQLPLATMDRASGTPTAASGQPSDVDELRQRVADVALEARQLVAGRRREGAVRSFDSLLTDVWSLVDPAVGASAASLAAVQSALASVQVVMVDEFQDTDGLQWSIFDHVFPVGRCPMVLVGDPKQSIYRFRSAELSAYLAARSAEGMDVATLGTNYRSDAAVLAGIERLYVRPTDAEPYVLGTDVDLTPAVHFRPVVAHHQGRRLTGMHQAQAVELRVLDPNGREVADEHERVRQVPTALRRVWIADDVARQVSWLLRADNPDDPDGRLRTVVRLEDSAGGAQRDLRPSDIAVLVSSNAEALAIAHRLGRSGIAAATATTSSVLDGAAAWQWRLLLAALARPASPGPVRAAALGWFVGCPAAELADPNGDLTWVHERFAHWAAVLRRGGPIALLAEARAAGLADRLLVRVGGERRVTDIEHIAELLQAAVGSRPASVLEVAEALDELAAGSATDAAADQMARRIDRDDDAVQVFTVHRAKGLEFPVVLCPFLWPKRSARGVPHAAIPLYDNKGAVVGSERRVLTPWLEGASSSTKSVLGDFALGKDVVLGGKAVVSRDRLELHEEADRLTYVALTRAAAHLVVWWASPADARGSGGQDQALARLLSHATGLATSELVTRPSKAVVLHGDAVAVREVDRDEPFAVRAAKPGDTDLDRARYTRSGDQAWRRWSYSGLSDDLVARDRIEAGDPAVLTAVDPDAGVVGGTDERGARGVADSAVESEPSGLASGEDRGGVDPFAGLGGTRFGTMVHAVLEEVDFCSDDLVGNLEAALSESMAHWRSAGAAPRVAGGLAAALAVPLGPPLRAPDTRLVSLPASHRLNELRFDLALGPASTDDLAAVLARDPEVTGPFGDWLDRLVGGPRVEGMLTGSIDLVGSFDGEQYWVADHKTNRLADGYGRRSLEVAMAHHDYPLQATLYLVALHRFLAGRLGGYDPERHLTGAAYLFVRGMAIDGTGVYWFTPSASTIVSVSDLLAGGDQR